MKKIENQSIKDQLQLLWLQKSPDAWEEEMNKYWVELNRCSNPIFVHAIVKPNELREYREERGINVCRLSKEYCNGKIKFYTSLVSASAKKVVVTIDETTTVEEYLQCMRNSYVAQKFGDSKLGKKAKVLFWDLD